MEKYSSGIFPYWKKMFVKLQYGKLKCFNSQNKDEFPSCVIDFNEF